jgi:nitrite reductase/ring-hydroxylating ferredoxin subunit
VRGFVLAMGGATSATLGGYLGGHLVGRLGVGVDNTAFEGRVAEWTRCCDLARVSERPTRCEVTPDASALVVRRGDTVLAVRATCPHRGAPLEEGTIADDAIVCPWHGSTFALADGSVRAGPAAVPLGAYDVRVVDGAVEVRDRRD